LQSDDDAVAKLLLAGRTKKPPDFHPAAHVRSSLRAESGERRDRLGQAGIFARCGILVNHTLCNAAGQLGLSDLQGSSSTGLVASGHIDVVIEAGLKLYDYAALVPVVEGAGGMMADWQGNPLDAGSDGTVIALGDPARLEDVLEAMG
jgi:hypothetical protein